MLRLRLAVVMAMVLVRSGAILENPQPAPSGWEYVSCYTDHDPPDRTLGPLIVQEIIVSEPGFQTNTDDNLACITYCSGLGYIYAGMQYGYNCICSNVIRTGLTYGTATPGICTASCPGAVTFSCGATGVPGSPVGVTAVSVYHKIGAVFELPAVPDPASLPTNWALEGCFTDDTSSNTLGTQALYGRFYGSIPNNAGTGNSAAACIALCAADQYIYAGVEGPQGKDCYCGNEIRVSASAGVLTQLEDNYCVAPCSGDKTEACGGVEHILIYKFDDTPDPTPTPTPPTPTPPTPTPPTPTPPTPTPPLPVCPPLL